MKRPPVVLELETFLPYRLSVLSNTLSGAIAAHYRDRYGLSMAEWRVMAVLGGTPGLAAAEIVERTAMDKVAVSRAVARLVEAGQVAGHPVPGDRRRTSLRLTAHGQSVYRDVAPWALAYERAVLGHLSAADRRALDSALKRLAAAAALVDPDRLADS